MRRLAGSRGASPGHNCSRRHRRLSPLGMFEGTGERGRTKEVLELAFGGRPLYRWVGMEKARDSVVDEGYSPPQCAEALAQEGPDCYGIGRGGRQVSGGCCE